MFLQIVGRIKRGYLKTEDTGAVYGAGAGGSSTGAEYTLWVYPWL